MTKFSVKKVNRGTIVDNLWEYRIWQHSGYNQTRVKQKLFRRPRRACKSSWSRRGNPKSLTLTIPWNLASLARNYPGIILTSTPRRSETNGIAERAVRRIKEGTSAEQFQSGLGSEWWTDSMKCYCHMRNIQDLLSDGKTSYERRFGMPFNGPVIPYGAKVEYHPISAKDRSRLHQFGAKVLPSIFSRFCITRGRNLERRHIGTDGRIRNPCYETQYIGSVKAQKWWTFLVIPDQRRKRKPLEEIRYSENIHCNPGKPRPRRRTKKSSRRIARVSTDTSRLVAERWRC